jgi:anti-sigma regulatory factor (Ser/Thr protein kinase)
MDECSPSSAPQGAREEACLRLEFPGDTAALGDVRTALRGFLSEWLNEESIEQIVLAVDEACTNVIRHALDGETKPVQLECHLQSQRLSIVLRDYGKPCDPKLVKGRALEDIRPGGLGVHIIQRVFDHVEYAPQPDGTRLTLEKRI